MTVIKEFLLPSAIALGCLGAGCAPSGVKLGDVRSDEMAPTLATGDRVYYKAYEARSGTKRLSRGDLVIISTSGLRHPLVRPNKLVIRRIVGLPKETISLNPPYVCINERKLTTPKVFKDISSMSGRYRGYVLPSGRGLSPILALATEYDSVSTGDDEYFVLADSPAAIDSRFYGAIRNVDIVGRILRIRRAGSQTEREAMRTPVRGGAEP